MWLDPNRRCLGERIAHAPCRPERSLPAEKENLDVAEKLSIERVDRRDERRDAFAVLEPPEEDDSANAVRNEARRRPCGLDGAACEVRSDDGAWNVPAARAHPVEHVDARRDDHVGELDARPLERLELERPDRAPVPPLS